MGLFGKLGDVASFIGKSTRLQVGGVSNANTRDMAKHRNVVQQVSETRDSYLDSIYAGDEPEVSYLENLLGGKSRADLTSQFENPAYGERLDKRIDNTLGLLDAAKNIMGSKHFQQNRNVIAELKSIDDSDYSISTKTIMKSQVLAKFTKEYSAVGVARKDVDRIGPEYRYWKDMSKLWNLGMKSTTTGDSGVDDVYNLNQVALDNLTPAQQVILFYKGELSNLNKQFDINVPSSKANRAIDLQYSRGSSNIQDAAGVRDKRNQILGLKHFLETETIYAFIPSASEQYISALILDILGGTNELGLAAMNVTGANIEGGIMNQVVAGLDKNLEKLLEQNGYTEQDIEDLLSENNRGSLVDLISRAVVDNWAGQANDIVEQFREKYKDQPELNLQGAVDSHLNLMAAAKAFTSTHHNTLYGKVLNNQSAYTGIHATTKYITDYLYPKGTIDHDMMEAFKQLGIEGTDDYTLKDVLLRSLTGPSVQAIIDTDSVTTAAVLEHGTLALVHLISQELPQAYRVYKEKQIEDLKQTDKVFAGLSDRAIQKALDDSVKEFVTKYHLGPKEFSENLLSFWKNNPDVVAGIKQVNLIEAELHTSYPEYSADLKSATNNTTNAGALQEQILLAYVLADLRNGKDVAKTIHHLPVISNELFASINESLDMFDQKQEEQEPPGGLTIGTKPQVSTDGEVVEEDTGLDTTFDNINEGILNEIVGPVRDIIKKNNITDADQTKYLRRVIDLTSEFRNLDPDAKDDLIDSIQSRLG